MSLPRSYDNSRNGDTVSTRIAALLQTIAQREPRLNAFTTLCADAALARADQLDRLAPAQRGSLHGLPIAVKEVIDVAGLPCAWGSAMHHDRLPDHTAPLVQALLDAGAVVVGMTASMEYAIAAAARTSHPTDTRRSPGGSSSGSAAAVGAGLVPLAMGTQTIGSIIRPAAYCGAVGYKPSHGLYSGDGMLCLSLALDHPGLIGDRMATVIAAHQVLATPSALPTPSLTGLRFVRPWYDQRTDDAVLDRLDALRRQLVGQYPLLPDLLVPADIAAREADVTHTLLIHDLALGHGAAVRACKAQASPRLLDLVVQGEAVSSAAYQHALSQRQDMITQLHDLLGPGEIAVAPATVDVAPLRAHGTGSRAPQRLWTLAGMPTLTLPVGLSEGLPIGVQLIARQGEDALLLDTARHLETWLESLPHG